MPHSDLQNEDDPFNEDNTKIKRTPKMRVTQKKESKAIYEDEHPPPPKKKRN